MNGLRDKYRQESKILTLIKKSRGYYPRLMIFGGTNERLSPRVKQLKYA
jgi:hypothetical protein